MPAKVINKSFWWSQFLKWGSLCQGNLFLFVIKGFMPLNTVWETMILGFPLLSSDQEIDRKYPVWFQENFSVLNKLLMFLDAWDDSDTFN